MKDVQPTQTAEVSCASGEFFKDQYPCIEGVFSRKFVARLQRLQNASDKETARLLSLPRRFSYVRRSRVDFGCAIEFLMEGAK